MAENPNDVLAVLREEHRATERTLDRIRHDTTLGTRDRRRLVDAMILDLVVPGVALVDRARDTVLRRDPTTSP